MRGFAESYFSAYPWNRPAEAPPMGYHTAAQVPVTHFLARAREFMVCDRWFAPLPTSTQPNRLMAYSGFSELERTRSWLLPDQHTFADWARERGKRWRSYHSAFPFFGLLPRMIPLLLDSDLFRNVQHLRNDLDDLQTPFPEIVFVEPAYDDAKFLNGGVVSSDNHPPIALEPGERFLSSVYTAVSGSKRWNETLMIVTYDEHGGFFDHVPPPNFTTPTPAGQTFNPFTTLGVRVPAILISPHIARGTVFAGSGASNRLDHTSILQLFADCFDGGNPYSDIVAARRQGADLARIADVISANPGPVPSPVAPTVAAAPPPSLVAPTVAAPTTPTPTPHSQAFEAAAHAHELVRVHGQAAAGTFPGAAAWVAQR